MILEDYIGKTITRKWKSEKGKKEYTVICNYPDKEHTTIIEERVNTFYTNYFNDFLQGFTYKELEIVVPVLKRCYELENQGHSYDEIEKIVFQEWEEKGLIKNPNNEKGDN